MKSVSVPLELLERVVAHDFAGDCQECGIGQSEAWKELRALLDKPAESVIDLDALDWESVKEAAAESKWMPPEYMRNDWVADVCAFLRSEPAAQQQGEPIKLSDDVREFLQEWIDSSTGGEDEDIDYDFANQLGVLLSPLYAEQPAPVAVVMTDDQILDAMREHITSADGGYVFDTAPQDVVAAGRALLGVARLDGVKP